MKLHIFVDEFPPFLRGGLGVYAMEVSKRLAKKNDVSIFTKGAKSGHEVLNGVNVLRVKVPKPSIYSSFLPPDVRNWGDGRIFYAETLFYNIISAYKSSELGDADLVVAHDWLSFPAGGIVSATLRKPLVVHFHSTEYGRMNNPSSAVCEIEKEGIENSELIITVSQAMKDEIKLHYGDNKIEVVYNGVDTEKYNPNNFKRDEIEKFKSKFTKDEKIVLFIGRLTWVKGVDSLIRAMPKIEKYCGKVKLVVVGKGEMENYLQNLAKDVGANCILRFEFVSERERILHYLSSDVVVIPSRYEPFGIVCSEAMACMKPVVVGAKGTSGLREQVIHGKTGFHIDPDNPHDIAYYTSLILNDEKMREDMGKEGRKRVLELFTWDKCAEKTEKIYKRFL